MLLQICDLETKRFRKLREPDQADTMIPPEPWQPPQLPPGAVQGQKRKQQAEAEVRMLEKRIAELMNEKRVWELELYGDSHTGTFDNRKPLQGPSHVDMWSDPHPPTAVSPDEWMAVRDGLYNKGKSLGGRTAHKESVGSCKKNSCSGASFVLSLRDFTTYYDASALAPSA